MLFLLFLLFFLLFLIICVKASYGGLELNLRKVVCYSTCMHLNFPFSSNIFPLQSQLWRITNHKNVIIHKAALDLSIWVGLFQSFYVMAVLQWSYFNVLFFFPSSLCRNPIWWPWSQGRVFAAAAAVRHAVRAGRERRRLRPGALELPQREPAASGWRATPRGVRSALGVEEGKDFQSLCR